MAIAIMSCRKRMNKCSGTKCFKVYRNSEDAFKVYGENKEDLNSFFYCVGCSDTITEGENWKDKMKELKESDIKTIHISRCISVMCNNYDKHEKILKNEGFEVVHGTHK